MSVLNENLDSTCNNRWYHEQFAKLEQQGCAFTKVGTNGKPYERELFVDTRKGVVEIKGGRSGMKPILLNYIVDVRKDLESIEFKKYCRNCSLPWIELLSRCAVLQTPERTFSLLFQNELQRDIVAYCIAWYISGKAAVNSGPGIAQKEAIDGLRSVNYTNGSKYVGQFRESKRHGSGTLTTADGTVYESEWQDDMKHGNGKEVWPDGTTFEGSYIEGTRHGNGVMAWPEGSRYIGQFEFGRAHGVGKLERTDGSVYTGQFRHDCMAGEGRMIWPDGVQYSGQFTDNRREGHGVITWVDGRWRSYDGEWKDGMQRGKGIYADHAGKEYHGTWVQDNDEWKLFLGEKDPSTPTTRQNEGAASTAPDVVSSSETEVDDDNKENDVAGPRNTRTRLMMKLWELGFHDVAKNQKALREGGGTLNGARTWLAENGQTGAALSETESAPLKPVDTQNDTASGTNSASFKPPPRRRQSQGSAATRGRSKGKGKGRGNRETRAGQVNTEENAPDVHNSDDDADVPDECGAATSGQPTSMPLAQITARNNTKVLTKLPLSQISKEEDVGEKSNSSRESLDDCNDDEEVPDEGPGAAHAQENRDPPVGRKMRARSRQRSKSARRKSEELEPGGQPKVETQRRGSEGTAQPGKSVRSARGRTPRRNRPGGANDLRAAATKTPRGPAASDVPEVVGDRL